MRNLNHDSSTITCFVTSLGTAMLHILKHSEGTVHQVVTLSAMDIDHHTHTTSIMLVLTLVQSFV